MTDDYNPITKEFLSEWFELDRKLSVIKRNEMTPILDDLNAVIKKFKNHGVDPMTEAIAERLLHQVRIATNQLLVASTQLKEQVIAGIEGEDEEKFEN